MNHNIYKAELAHCQKSSFIPVIMYRKVIKNQQTRLSRFDLKIQKNPLYSFSEKMLSHCIQPAEVNNTIPDV